MAVILSAYGIFKGLQKDREYHCRCKYLMKSFERCLLEPACPQEKSMQHPERS
jgi:hypothetical protein